IKKADERIKEELNKKIKTLIKLAGEEKAEYKQNIKDLQTKIAEQDKTIEELKKTAKNKGEVKQQPIKTFNCYHCHKSQELPLLVLELPEDKKEQEYKVKIDSTLQEYPTCSTCLPLIKEYNEKEKDTKTAIKQDLETIKYDYIPATTDKEEKLNLTTDTRASKNYDNTKIDSGNIINKGSNTNQTNEQKQINSQT
ncbi:11527_t:CDS:2, partial [Funneliformis geosporum]